MNAFSSITCFSVYTLIHLTKAPQTVSKCVYADKSTHLLEITWKKAKYLFLSIWNIRRIATLRYNDDGMCHSDIRSVPISSSFNQELSCSVIKMLALVWSGIYLLMESYTLVYILNYYIRRTSTCTFCYITICYFLTAKQAVWFGFKNTALNRSAFISDI